MNHVEPVRLHATNAGLQRKSLTTCIVRARKWSALQAARARQRAGDDRLSWSEVRILREWRPNFGGRILANIIWKSASARVMFFFYVESEQNKHKVPRNLDKLSDRRWQMAVGHRFGANRATPKSSHIEIIYLVQGKHMGMLR